MILMLLTPELLTEALMKSSSKFNVAIRHLIIVARFRCNFRLSPNSRLVHEFNRTIEIVCYFNVNLIDVDLEGRGWPNGFRSSSGTSISVVFVERELLSIGMMGSRVAFKSSLSNLRFALLQCHHWEVRASWLFFFLKI